MNSVVREVPCNGCFACCQGDAIFIHPECGDNINDYLVERYNGRWILQHKENDDCIYLDRETGCTIHGRAPAICSELDCRKVYKKFKHNPKMLAQMPKGMMEAAKRLKRKGRLK